MPLSVAGAFHTHHMEPAVGHLGSLARSVSVHDPRTRFVSNRDGQVVHDGRDVLRRIVGQIASPVRWDLCMDTFEDLGVTGILEMPPAGTLTGIAKRALKGVETFALKGPEPARRGPRVLRQARRVRRDRLLADLADGRLPRQGHLPHRAGGRGRRRPGVRRRRSARWPASATGSASPPRTAARSSSGWSRTATWSRPGSHCSGCTPREARHDRHRGRRPAPRTPASSASAPTGRRG